MERDLLEEYDASLPAWTPLERCEGILPKELRAYALQEGVCEVYVNSRFVVQKRHVGTNSDGSSGWWLSIRDTNRTSRHDWRDLQQIKNELCGLESEGIEIYPPESKLVDTSCQFHLWVFEKPQVTSAGIGFQKRDVSETVSYGKSRQRLFDAHVRPGDLEEQEASVKQALLHVAE